MQVHPASIKKKSLLAPTVYDIEKKAYLCSHNYRKLSTYRMTRYREPCNSCTSECNIGMFTSFLIRSKNQRFKRDNVLKQGDALIPYLHAYISVRHISTQTDCCIRISLSLLLLSSSSLSSPSSSPYNYSTYIKTLST